ncbi:MAG: hypothetical protein JSW55_15530 [Chloroflexota bacterium]|nr:MAG: hypothetical protein JSW55_15530 [Chloroflexota bacterium]
MSVDIVGSGDESASFQRPAYVAAEIVGRDISNVSLIGGSVADDGTRRVMIYRPIDPDLGDEEWPGNWTDGVHEIIQTWDFGGDFLFDGRNGDFVMLWTTDPQSETRTVHGRFRSSGVDDYANAVLTVNTTSGAVEDLIETETGMSLAFEAGDEFQLANLILADDYSLHSEPGISLFFDDGAQLAYTSRPDRSGNYFLGVSAESAGGDSNMTLVDFRVDNDALNPGHRTYFDPHRGIQFQYPESWKGSIDRQGLLAFNDPSGTTSISISTHPDMSGRPAVDLKNMALETYGSVTVLYEDQVEIGQGGGLRTVYGYESAGGSRTGVMLTFSQDGQPFLIDIDGPSSNEAATLELAGVVAGSWDSRPVVASDSGRWVEIVVDGLGVAAPADYSHSHMGNGWHRFAGPTDQIFIAFRAEPVTDPGLSRRMEYWTEVARRNVDDFAGSPLRTVRRGDREWARVDIEYRLETGDMVAGVIMSSKFGDGELVIWGEAPADQYPQIEAEVLMVAVDELSHAAPPQPDSARSP